VLKILENVRKILQKFPEFCEFGIRYTLQVPSTANINTKMQKNSIKTTNNIVFFTVNKILESNIYYRFYVK